MCRSRRSFWTRVGSRGHSGRVRKLEGKCAGARRGEGFEAGLVIGFFLAAAEEEDVTGAFLTEDCEGAGDPGFLVEEDGFPGGAFRELAHDADDGFAAGMEGVDEGVVVAWIEEDPGVAAAAEDGAAGVIDGGRLRAIDGADEEVEVVADELLGECAEEAVGEECAGAFDFEGPDGAEDVVAALDEGAGAGAGVVADAGRRDRGRARGWRGRILPGSWKARETVAVERLASFANSTMFIGERCDFE